MILHYSATAEPAPRRARPGGSNAFALQRDRRTGSPPGSPRRKQCFCPTARPQNRLPAGLAPAEAMILHYSAARRTGSPPGSSRRKQCFCTTADRRTGSPPGSSRRKQCFCTTARPPNRLPAGLAPAEACFCTTARPPNRLPAGLGLKEAWHRRGKLGGGLTQGIQSSLALGWESAHIPTMALAKIHFRRCVRHRTPSRWRWRSTAAAAARRCGSSSSACPTPPCARARTGSSTPSSTPGCTGADPAPRSISLRADVRKEGPVFDLPIALGMLGRRRPDREGNPGRGSARWANWRCPGGPARPRHLAHHAERPRRGLHPHLRPGRERAGGGRGRRHRCPPHRQPARGGRFPRGPPRDPAPALAGRAVDRGGFRLSRRFRRREGAGVRQARGSKSRWRAATTC